MPHRPADSRLLVNLISHEKEYFKHLQALFDPAHSSLSAFTAYASASAPPLSNTIITVATSLAAADDALARYADAVDQYREHLNHIKSLEDDVANIFRDREILVTRLIKASKSHKPGKSASSSSLNRNSLHLTPTNPSSSTSSLASGFSPNSPLPLSSTLPTSAKLSAAQAELQACEAQLATKERQLAIERVNALKEGLTLRLKGLIECGWVWGEAGKKALGALDSLTGENNDAIVDKPLPPLTYPGNHVPDDVSSVSNSLAPSQSASQTGEHTIYIPPAHAISDSNPFPSRHVLSRRITEEELTRFDANQASSDPAVNREDEGEDGGSSADEALSQQQEAEQLKVVENPRFATSSKKKSKQKPEMLITGDSAATGPKSVSSVSPPLSPSAKSGIFRRNFSIRQPSGSAASLPGHAASSSGSPLRGRSRAEGSISSVGSGGGSGFFGSIRGLFFGRNDSTSRLGTGTALSEPPIIDGLPASSSQPDDGLSGGIQKPKAKWKGKKWEMDRTEKNLKNVKTNVESDDDDETARGALSALPSAPPAGMVSLKKRRRVASDVGVGIGAGGASGSGAEANSGIGQIVGPSASTSHLPQPEPQLPRAQQQQQPSPGVGRKLKKTKVRSASVPPPTSSSAEDRTGSRAINGGETVVGGLETGGDVKSQRRTSLARRKSQKGKEKDGQEEGRTGSVKQGVKEGFSVTVVSSSEPSTSSSARDIVDATPSGVASAPVSRRSSTSTKAGRKASVQKHVLEPDKAMMSLLSAVADGDKGVSKSGEGSKGGGPKEKDQVKGKEKESATRGSGSAMEIPKAPESVLEPVPANAGGRNDASVEVGVQREQEREMSEKDQKTSPRSSLSLTRSPPTLLKSALRNSSRTPSPLPRLPPPTLTSVRMASEPDVGRASGSEDLSSGGAVSKAPSAPEGADDNDDTASISSYETGLEMFFDPDHPDGADGDDDDKDTIASNSTATPVIAPTTLPPVEEPQLTSNGSAAPNHSSAGPATTGTKIDKDARGAQTPVPSEQKKQDDASGHRRRKSVRVSLQPTFSPTPPAIEYEEEEVVWKGSGGQDSSAGGRNEAWWHDVSGSTGRGGGQEKVDKGKARKGGKRREAEEKDVWEDSSEEDVEYTRARRLLSRALSPTRGHGTK